MAFGITYFFAAVLHATSLFVSYPMASIPHGIAGKAEAIQSSLFSAPLLCIWLLILNYIHPASAILTTCYDPSGNVRPDVPCRQDAVASACCGINWSKASCSRNCNLQTLTKCTFSMHKHISLPRGPQGCTKSWRPGTI